MSLNWRPRARGFFVAAIGIALAIAALDAAQGGAGRGQAGAPAVQQPAPGQGIRVDARRGPVDLALTDPALVGAIDIHAHLDPDSPGTGEVVRGIDVMKFAKIAQSRGMRGFVMKTHQGPQSAAAAYLAREYAAPGLEVFGLMALNLASGGINVAAVYEFVHIKGGWGRIVMMPTRDASRERANQSPEYLANARPWIQFLPPGAPTIVDTVRNGKLLPEVVHLIGVMSKMPSVDSNGPLVLATGHATPEEALLMAREGRRQGLQVVVTHGGGTAPEFQEAAKLGAFLEYNSAAVVRDFSNAKAMVQLMRKVGVQSIVIGTDCGQMNNPHPADCMALMAKALRTHGLTERELNAMFKENPAKLLGLVAARASGGADGKSSVMYVGAAADVVAAPPQLLPSPFPFPLSNQCLTRPVENDILIIQNSGRIHIKMLPSLRLAALSSCSLAAPSAAQTPAADDGYPTTGPLSGTWTFTSTRATAKTRSSISTASSSS